MRVAGTPSRPEMRLERNGLRYYRTPYGDLPSVTTVMRRGSTFQAPDYTRERGSILHSLIDAWLAGRELPDVPAWLETQWLGWVAWARSVAIDQPLTEHAVWSALGYAGTFDMVAYIDGRLTLVDWKTKGGDPTGEQLTIHASQRAQLAAYAGAWHELGGEPIEQYGVGLIYPKQTVMVLEPTTRDGWDRFQLALDGWYGAI